MKKNGLKVLMVNKFYYIKGGSETYYFALRNKLLEEGFSIVDFSMKDDNNFTSEYSDYFVNNVDYSSAKSLKKSISMAKNIVYSKEAKVKFEELIKREKPDIIHLHIFQHQISPSILDVIKKYKIPTVYTAHDLKMLCLNYKMMHHGKICEKCGKGNYYNCFFNKCVKDSYLKSLINVVEGYFHKYRKSYDVINYIITPSYFYKTIFEKFGISTERVIHIPNFMDAKKNVVNKKEDYRRYYLYFGRLSEEKGIFTLLKAVEKIDINLYIVGTGPLQYEIEDYVKKNNLYNVKILGFMSGQELVDVVGNAKAVILPSEWYENGPYSAIEALEMGRPIIGADIGGIPELVSDNGFLFNHGSVKDLTKKICLMEAMSDQEYSQMENNSKLLFEKNYTWTQHYKKLKKVYEKLLKREII